MRQILRYELANVWRHWWATAVAITLASAVCATANIARGAVASMAATDADSTRSYCATLVGFTVLTAFAVVSITVDLAIGACRRRLALLALGGMTPRQTMGMVYAHCAAVAVPSTLVGALVALPAAHLSTALLVHAAAQATPSTGTPNAATDAMAGAALVLGVAILGATKGARQARDISPLEALQQIDPPIPRRSRVRRSVAIGSTIALVIMFLTAVATPLATLFIPQAGSGPDVWSPSTADTAISAGIGACLALTSLLAAAAPRYAPVLMRMWTWLLPSGISPSWVIARGLATARLGRGTAAVTLMIVAATATGGLFSVLNTGAAALHQSTGGTTNGVNTSSIVAMLAGPFALALVGAALTAVTTLRDRLAELTSIQIAGATPRQLALIPILEIFMYAGTAALVSLVAEAILATLVSAGFLTQTVVLPRVALLPALGIPALGGALLALAILPQLARGHWRPALARLAAE